jgi:hypothetical protein
MGANNLYFPAKERTYRFTKDNYIIIDSKLTGLPLKININEFFEVARQLGFIPNPIANVSAYTSTAFTIAQLVPYNITIPNATEIIDVSLYDTAGVKIEGLVIDITSTQVTFNSNITLANVIAKVVYK